MVPESSYSCQNYLHHPDPLGSDDQMTKLIQMGAVSLWTDQSLREQASVSPSVSPSACFPARNHSRRVHFLKISSANAEIRRRKTNKSSMDSEPSGGQRPKAAVPTVPTCSAQRQTQVTVAVPCGRPPTTPLPHNPPCTARPHCRFKLCCGATEVQHRCNRGATDMQQRCNKGATEVQQRCNRDAAELQQLVQQRCNKGATEMQQRCNSGPTALMLAKRRVC